MYSESDGWDELCDFIKSLGYGFPLNACSQKGLEWVCEDLLKLGAEKQAQVDNIRKAVKELNRHIESLDPPTTTKSMQNYLYKIGIPLEWYGTWPESYCHGDLWGYGKDMEKVRQEIAQVWADTKG